MLIAAKRAPSAGFSGVYALRVLHGPAQLAPLLAARGNGRRWWRRMRAIAASLANAPLVVVPLSCKDIYLERCARPDKG